MAIFNHQFTFFEILGTTSGVLLLISLWLWGKYNTFIKTRNQVKTDFSDIDVQLKRRASLIERLAQLVKEYATHEKGTFENVAKARAALDTSKTAKEAAKAENMFTDTLKSLFAVVESHPKLQASQNYKDVQVELATTENLIAKYREEYNKTVQHYNNLVLTFPSLLAAKLFNFYEEDLFKQ